MKKGRDNFVLQYIVVEIINLLTLVVKPLGRGVGVSTSGGGKTVFVKVTAVKIILGTCMGCL